MPPGTHKDGSGALELATPAYLLAAVLSWLTKGRKDMKRAAQVFEIGAQADQASLVQNQLDRIGRKLDEAIDLSKPQVEKAAPKAKRREPVGFLPGSGPAGGLEGIPSKEKHAAYSEAELDQFYHEIFDVTS